MRYFNPIVTKTNYVNFVYSENNRMYHFMSILNLNLKNKMAIYG